MKGQSVFNVCKDIALTCSLKEVMLIMEDFRMIFTCFYPVRGRIVSHTEAKGYW